MEDLQNTVTFIKANWDSFLYLWSILCTAIVAVASIVAKFTHNEVDPKTIAGKAVLFADRFAIRKEITTVVKK